MRRQAMVLIAAVIVLALLALGGTASAMGLTHNGMVSNPGYGSGMMNSSQEYQNQHGMMSRQNTRSGMMSGYQQNTGTQETPVSGMTHMTMQNSLYQYTNMQVRVGTVFTWTNLDAVPHSVTFKNGMKDSGLLAQGQSFSYTFNTPGNYSYYCTIHPSMVASVTVVS